MDLTGSVPIQNQNGTIVFAGTTTEITIFFNYLKSGQTTEDFLEDYPQVNLEKLLDLLELAEDQLREVVL